MLKYSQALREDKSVNKLAQQTRIIDAYVAKRQAAGNLLSGEEEQAFDWIAENLKRAADLKKAGKLIAFFWLYGQLRGAAAAFIQTYVSSESRQ